MTTPAQPESKTPITDEIREIARQGVAIVLEHQEAGWEPLAQLLADFVEGREAALNETNNLLAIYFGACRENYQAQSIQAEADRREVESANAIKSAEKKILIKEIENHVVTKQALITAQQRIKELEADERRLKKISLMLCFDYSVSLYRENNGMVGLFSGGILVGEGETSYQAIDAAMSREPKESEAK